MTLNDDPELNRILMKATRHNQADMALYAVESNNACLKRNSVRHRLLAIRFGDHALNKPYTEASVAEYTAMVSAFRGHYALRGLRTQLVLVRQYVRWLWTRQPLASSLKEELRRRKDHEIIERALKVRRERETVVGQIISESDCAALLVGGRPRYNLDPAFPVHVRNAALWATLRHSGFRIGELVSLDVGDVTDNGDTFVLRLRGERPMWPPMKTSTIYKPDLKSGPRTIHMAGGRTQMLAWMKMHPAASEPNAPLFVTAHRRGIKRLPTTAARMAMQDACSQAGLASHKTQKLTPHDFRHTCATEKARLGWNEPQMRQFFGWSPGSKTPSTYIHLNLDDMQRRIMNDAKTLAGTIAPESSVSRMSALLEEILRRQAQAPAAGTT